MTRWFRLFRIVQGFAPLLVLCSSVRTASAQADLMELHGYIEPCTIGSYQEANTECELCPVKLPNPESCAQNFGERGYTKACRTRGAHDTWEEIWCVPTDANGKRLEKRKSTAFPTAPTVSVGLAALLGIAYAWWRHRQSKA